MRPCIWWNYRGGIYVQFHVNRKWSRLPVVLKIFEFFIRVTRIALITLPKCSLVKNITLHLRSIWDKFRLLLVSQDVVTLSSAQPVLPARLPSASHSYPHWPPVSHKAPKSQSHPRKFVLFPPSPKFPTARHS